MDAYPSRVLQKGIIYASDKILDGFQKVSNPFNTAVL